MPRRTPVLALGSRAILATLALSLSGFPLTDANAQSAACDLSAVTRPRVRDIFPVASRQVSYSHRTTFGFTPQTGGLVKVTETTTVDLSDLQTKFPRLVRDAIGREPSSCEREVNGVNSRLRDNGNGSVDTSFKIWACVNVPYPCPTLTEPGRFCSRETKTHVTDGSVNVRLALRSSVRGGRVRLRLAQTSANVSVDNDLARAIYQHFARVGRLLDPNLSPSLEGEIARNLRRIDETIRLPATNGQAVDIYRPTLASTAVRAIGGASNQRLGMSIVREQTFREGTACFLRGQL